MKLKVTDPCSFNIDNFRQLIASYDDSVHRQIQISNDGYCFFADRVGLPYDSDIKFFLEIWVAGNGYSGPTAALDDAYLNGEFEKIKEAWASGRVGMIDL